MRGRCCRSPGTEEALPVPRARCAVAVVQRHRGRRVLGSGAASKHRTESLGSCIHSYQAPEAGRRRLLTRRRAGGRVSVSTAFWVAWRCTDSHQQLCSTATRARWDATRCTAVPSASKLALVAPKVEAYSLPPTGLFGSPEFVGGQRCTRRTGHSTGTRRSCRGRSGRRGCVLP